LGFKKNRKNRYKRKPPVKKEAVGIRQSLRILFKSAFFALLIGVMSLSFIFVHDVITQCDYFRADTISVEGCERLTEKQILDAAKIKEGDNFVSMNLRTIRERLLVHPWIAKAEIVRTPSGIIAISVLEQKPLAVVDFGKRFLINEDGVIFKEAEASEVAGLPVMSGIDYSDWKASETPGAPFLSSVLEILRAGCTPDGVLTNDSIKHILIDREVGLTLQVEGPVRMVKLGYGNYDVKCSRLGRILSYLATDTNIPFIEELDLRNPDSIVARPGIVEESEKVKKEV